MTNLTYKDQAPYSILVNPGEFSFSASPDVIRTLLGSCVAISVWHPELKIGGLCHYLLASAAQQKNNNFNYRYGNIVLPELLRNMNAFDSEKSFEFGIYGGSCLNEKSNSENIGKSNLQFAWQWLDNLKITPHIDDTGGNYCRIITLSLENGSVTITKYQIDSEEVYTK